MDAKVADLQQQLEKIANDMRRDEKDAARKLDEAAGSIRDKRIREKIRYTKGALQSAGSQYARGMEDDIGANLEALQKKIGDAAGSVGKGSSRTRWRVRRTRRATWCAGWNPFKANCRMANCRKGRIKDSKDNKGSRDSRGSRPARVSRDSRVSRDNQASRGSKVSRDNKASRVRGKASGSAGAGRTERRRRRDQRLRRRRSAQRRLGRRLRPLESRRHPPVPRSVPRVGQRRRRPPPSAAAGRREPARSRRGAAATCARSTTIASTRIPRGLEQLTGRRDREVEEVRVLAAPQGRHRQRFAGAVGFRPGPRGIPSGDRGVPPLAGEEERAAAALGGAPPCARAC